ncbi:TonB-dependent receptor [Chryseosolibacter indicus]|uniref:Carboxypeptidase regulatory-like domain-containing protein n=1 Tax=Chryseosolibacter indicus TaxID=2782351 RepID=A0ABS5VTK7_9BACT|nr:carboxypeptidase regulatory-like domain-containing protein [Chryseosolibacter indicus]MBT1704758.1 carboxypeptidase regulatory-like domain-containing protein [Chryseosolibacter indicus]
MKKLYYLFAFVCLVFNYVAVNAQTTHATISGTVTGNQNEVLVGATVLVKNESTGFTTGTQTNAQGDFLFKELPLGGPYTVTVSYIGFSEQKQTGFILHQGDAIRVKTNLQESNQSLDAVEVEASSLQNQVENFGASTSISAREITKLPVNGRNFTTLMDLSPLSRGGNIAGQLGSSTNYTIDGMNAKNPTSAGSTTSRSGAPYSISMEAVREFQVVTNQYDVTYGRSGGGVVSAVTKSGTNQFSGSLFNYSRADWLSSPYDIRGNKNNNKFATHQFGFSLGGPIIKDKLHFFVAWDHQLDSRPLIIADIQSPVDENRFNITTSTLNRFVDIARQQYGVSQAPQFGSFDKERNSDAAFARIDWQINGKNLLTIRDNFTLDKNKLGLQDNTSINILESYGNDYNTDNSFLASLRTSIDSRFTNELKVQHLYTYQKSSPGDQLPSANIPRAIVENVASTLEDGTTRSTNIQMGGHRFAQERFENHVIQVIDNLYFTTDKIDYTFGVDFMYTNSRSVYGSEVNGRFHYTVDNTAGKTALDKFESLEPYRYYREVPLVDDWGVKGNIFNAGAYAQMSTTLTTGLNMTAGLRYDYGFYPKSPLNQELYNELQIRTDHRLKSSVIQPRLQFTWDINDNHRDIIRLGGGVFASDINNYVLINNLTFDGKHLATVDVRSPNIPIPNFAEYRNNYASIPSLDAFQLPTINTNGADVKVPVIYKANLSYNRFINENLKVGITGYATLGRNNYFYVDRNMVDDPYFTLTEEGGRGVYVPLSTMPTNGAGDWLQGRKSAEFGRVLELVSEGKINQFALVADATYRYFRDGVITVSYTWNDTKDNTSFNGNVANSATLSLPVTDDPRDLSKMTYSDNQFRHKVVVYGSLPSFWGISLGVRFSGVGGTRYSLLSGANSNGDFVSGTNDLAFIFDRNNESVPANVRTGLQAVLDNPKASQSVKDYINKYSGRMAERNGGINGFYGVWDVRANKRFKLYKEHAIELSVDIFNVANLLNKEWGRNESLGTQALYALGIPATATTPAVPNFDKANQRFNYRVNTAGVVTPSGNPYQFQLGARYSF